MQDVIDELRRYVTGWLNYFGLSDTYSALMELDEWVRRRVRLYYWKSRGACALGRNSRGHADAICSHSEFRGRRSTWPRAAAKGAGG